MSRAHLSGFLAASMLACSSYSSDDEAPKGDAGLDTGVAPVDAGSPADASSADASSPDASSTDAGYCWPYRPTNYDPCAAGFDQEHPSEGDRTVTSDTTLDTESAKTIVDGVTYAFFRYKSLTVAAGATLAIKGPRPALIVVDGDVNLSGRVVAEAGPDAPAECGSSLDIGSRTTNWTPGGSGGGYGATGGKGGNAIAAGTASGNETITPLRFGCPGGRGGVPQPVTNGGNPGALAALGGVGGGALEISARGRLEVGLGGHVLANGRGGAGGDAHKGGSGPCQTSDAKGCTSGGGGGGSGGSILLEGATLQVMGIVCAVGGGGGAGGNEDGVVGKSGETSSSCAAAAGGPTPVAGGAGLAEAGKDGSTTCGSYTSCGGGGGGAGRIRIRSLAGNLTVTGTVAPPPYTK